MRQSHYDGRNVVAIRASLTFVCNRVQATLLLTYEAPRCEAGNLYISAGLTCVYLRDGLVSMGVTH